MDAIYAWQRHIYDATRKYFLFGRDRLIATLNVPECGTVLEIGCGRGIARMFAERCSGTVTKTHATSPGIAHNLPLNEWITRRA